MTKQKKAVQKKPSGTEPARKKAGRGTAKLKEAADKALANNSTVIAQALVDKTIAGNSTIARLLLSLAEVQVEGEEEAVAERRPSPAEELASDPEWKGEPEEAEADSTHS